MLPDMEARKTGSGPVRMEGGKRPVIAAAEPNKHTWDREGFSVAPLAGEDEDSAVSVVIEFHILVRVLVSVAIVGTRSTTGPFPEVENVIGSFGRYSWFGEQAPVHGRYTVSHAMDVHCYKQRSCAN